MKRIIIVAVMATYLTACGGNPKDLIVPNETKDWSPKLRAALEKMPSEDSKLLMGYFMRVKIEQATGGKGVPEGMTVGKAIEEQRVWLKNSKKR